MANELIFAVVGHPNKGKSSIVSTLSRNDSIEISARSGTTSKADRYDVNILDTGYTLYDTPGFQRPRQVLNWLKKYADNASERPQAVKDFVNDADARRAFPDEVELLKPIIDGAAILYVVDCSHPYGPEYELEMEILRWCGNPRMALINPISSDEYLEDWSDALGQYFNVVQVFNPMLASLDHQIELIQAFEVLSPPHKEQLIAITEALSDEVLLWHKQSAVILANLLEEVCSHKQSQKVLKKSQADLIEPELKRRFEATLKQKEQEAFRAVKHLFRHMRTEAHIKELVMPPDLFDVSQWYLWGLSKKQLVTSLAVSGMLAGGAIDMAVGGASFMLGSAVGGLTGLASGLISSETLDKFKLNNVPLVGQEACYGPNSDYNFPYVVINRFLHLFKQLSHKNHADRRNIEITVPSWDLILEGLDETIRRQLQLQCTRLVRQKYVDHQDLTDILYAVLTHEWES